MQGDYSASWVMEELRFIGNTGYDQVLVCGSAVTPLRVTHQIACISDIYITTHNSNKAPQHEELQQRVVGLLGRLRTLAVETKAIGGPLTSSGLRSF